MIPLEGLCQVGFFQDLPQGILKSLSQAALPKTVSQNDFIVHQHDEANSVYFLLSGIAQVYLHLEGADWLLVGKIKESGSLIGWSAFRAPFRYTASIKCEEECQVIQIPRDLFDKLFKEDPDFGFRFLGRVAESVANRLDQTKVLFNKTPIPTDPSPDLKNE